MRPVMLNAGWPYGDACQVIPSRPRKRTAGFAGQRKIHRGQTGGRIGQRLRAVCGPACWRFSAVQRPAATGSLVKRDISNGTFGILTDNGFGTEVNSPGAMPYLNRCSIDIEASGMTWLKTVRPSKEMGRLASPRWPPGVVVKSGWLVSYPRHKRSNFRM